MGSLVSEREVKVMRRLRNPYVIRLNEVITTQLGCHLVMELADGTLSQCHERITPVSYHVYCRPLPMENLVEDMWGAVQGLLYLKKSGFVHADIKPENLLRGSDNRVKVADFGLSRFVGNMTSASFMMTQSLVSLQQGQQNASQANLGKGSPAFLAPELLELENAVPSHESDVWALGITAYMLAYGFHPFADN
ncbi:calcium/calmodulin-dependent/calcium-dependent protein kinase, partial [Kipferlia bialata]|eukprot:g11608.t1